MDIFIALLPALFWGVLPLAVAKIGGSPVQQIIGTTAGTFVVALVLAFFLPPTLGLNTFLLCLLSGAFWAFGQINQYRAFTQIGVSNTMPISTGMQLVSTSLVGVLAFGEWASLHAKILGFIAIGVIVLGIYFTTKHEQQADSQLQMKTGIITLCLSTLGYVGYSYFPRLANVSGQDAFLAQALGMLVCALLMSRVMPAEPAFNRKTAANILCGVIFAAAALSYLVSAERNGIATGFTLSQMNVVIGTLGSIFLLGERKTPKEMRFILFGLALVVMGGVAIGLNHGA